MSNNKLIHQGKSKLFTLCAISMLSTASMAGDYLTNISFNCPSVGPFPGLYEVTNSGTSISGLALVKINDKTRAPVLFQGLANGVPLDLVAAGYHRNATVYQVNFSTVGCSYHTEQAFPEFTIFYNIKKGAGGQVVNSSANFIKIQYLWGLKK